MKYLLCALLVASPLAAQQGNTIITVNDTTVVTITDNDSTFIFVETAPRDSAAVARDEAAQRAMDQIAEYLATCDCMGGGATPTVVRVGQGALVLAAFFIGWQLKRIADRPPDVHHDGDVEVNVPPDHTHDDHDSESYGEN